MVQVDRLRLAQVLANLLSNAAKFTSRGTITLSVAKHEREGGDRLVIEVRDTGIGFVASDEAGLYQRFHQLDGSTTRQYGGLGIGLAICRSIIEYHEGRLFFEPRPGGGSAFCFTLPRAQGRA